MSDQALNDRQLDGLACITCGTDFEVPGSSAEPRGFRERGQLFVCCSGFGCSAIPAVEVGQIWRDNHDRWMSVESTADDRAEMRVIAQQIGERVMAPMRAVSMDLAKVPKRMTLVDAAPAPTGPDIAEVTIDYAEQTIDLGAGPVPYYVGSSGPRLKSGADNGSALVTLTLYVGKVRSIYGGDQ